MKQICLCIFSFFFASYGVAQTLDTLRMKARNGDATSMLAIAELFEFGMEVETNLDSAQKWTFAAANHGHAEAQFLVGLQLCQKIFDYGKFAKGIDWLNKSAEQENVNALRKLAEIYSDNGNDGINVTASSKYYSRSSAFEYAKKAAENGDPKMALFCGEALLKGSGIAKDIPAGIIWLQFAANENNMAAARLALGRIYFEGIEGGERNLFLALEQFQKVYDQSASNIDLRVEADIEIHKVDQCLKKTHNLMIQSGMMVAPESFSYPLRN